MKIRNGFAVIAVLVACAGSSASHAEVNLAGGWGWRFHEDYSDRWPGPRAGDYLGLALNDAGRQVADSWSSSLINMPERQCVSHPADYATRGPANMVWETVNDMDTNQVVGWRYRVSWMSPERTIWMDGRPQPDASAPHVRQGFSTGEWVGDDLVVTTTHLKAGYLRRNGVPRSDQAVVRQHWLRNGPYLTNVTIVYDPVYYDAPQIWSVTYVQDLGLTKINPQPCAPAIEIPRAAGDVPTVMPWAPTSETDIDGLAAETGLPMEAVRGGNETTYPEYMKKLKALPVYPEKKNPGSKP